MNKNEEIIRKDIAKPPNTFLKEGNNEKKLGQEPTNKNSTRQDKLSQAQVKEKVDQTDLLLNIEYLNKIFSKSKNKFDKKYELIEPIKAGSAGAVYKTRIKCNNRFIASKILLNNLKEKNIYKKNKEVLIHKRIHNKNVPELYGYYPLDENHSIMLIEYNKYGDLENFKRNVIKRSSLSETLICYIAGGIIDALFYLNQKKIIHMDIKQQNILVDEYLNIKITDYSISILYGNDTNYIQLPISGTCYYMSPEVLQKTKILVSEASKIDIYSFGVLLYLLAFNDYPYELDKVDPKNYNGILKNIKEKELHFPKDTGHSTMFKNFLKKCLEKDIKKRYNIYNIINDPWYKGYRIILNEKENLYNAGIFMTEILVDNIRYFNDYIKE